MPLLACTQLTLLCIRPCSKAALMKEPTNYGISIFCLIRWTITRLLRLAHYLSLSPLSDLSELLHSVAELLWCNDKETWLHSNTFILLSFEFESIAVFHFLLYLFQIWKKTIFELILPSIWCGVKEGQRRTAARWASKWKYNGKQWRKTWSAQPRLRLVI